MKIFFSTVFQKNLNKLPSKIQKQFEARIELFQKIPPSPMLKIHPLKGNLAGLRAFSVTGDYRVIYRIIGLESVELVDIGKHNQVY